VTSIASTFALPGVRFTAVPRPTPPSALRSDVAGFLGRTRRGPVGVPVRVEGHRAYLREFGGLDGDAVTSYAIRSYFENGGEVAWVVRLGDAGKPAEDLWRVGERRGFLNTAYRVEASSPGAWANGTTVTIRVQRVGRDDRPTVELGVQAPGEPPEVLAGLDPRDLEGPDGLPSALIRLVPVGERQGCGAPPGPRRSETRLELFGGSLVPPDRFTYQAAAGRLGDEPEVALVAAPDLATDLRDEERLDLLVALALRADELHDRLVLVDLPCGRLAAGDVIREVAGLAGALPGRAAAVYHPWVAVTDPLGGIAAPRRTIPPSGSVAGLISRLDRERGAQHTPANAELEDAVDLSRSFPPAEEALFAGRVNLLRCAPGRGLQVWGGRTLDSEPAGRFVAHRRLVHRLVRALRRVAEPLVFETNGPELWLAFLRAATTVLLEAWRAGGLQGSRPQEAFRVQCDAALNPPAERDLGRVLCRIAFAPAVPMEFIELRVALSADGRLEVLTP
jgi:phage tail sheath protein FI